MAKSAFVEYPSVKKINPYLWYQLVEREVTENPYTAYAKTLENNINSAYGINTQSASVPMKHNYCYRLYKMPLPTQTAEQAKKYIKSGEAIAIEDVSPVGYEVGKPDANGNYLFRSAGSKLEDIPFICGDLLVDKTGNVLKNTQAESIIRDADEHFGYYPVDVFKTKVDKSGNPQVVERLVNFLSPDGKFVQKEPFKIPDTPQLVKIQRVFSGDNNGKVFISKDIYPESYVYLSRNECKYFPCATALLCHQRNLEGIAMEEGKPEDLVPRYYPKSMEGDLLNDYYKRSKAVYKINQKINNSNISGGLYKKLIDILFRGEESIYNQLFENEFMTSSDGDFFDDLDLDASDTMETPTNEIDD